MEAAIDAYYPQRAIHTSAMKDQRDVESGRRKIDSLVKSLCRSN